MYLDTQMKSTQIKLFYFILKMSKGKGRIMQLTDETKMKTIYMIVNDLKG